MGRVLGIDVRARTWDIRNARTTGHRVHITPSMSGSTFSFRPICAHTTALSGHHALATSASHTSILVTLYQSTPHYLTLAA